MSEDALNTSGVAVSASGIGDVIVQVDHLCVTYKSVVAVHDISLRISAGEIVGLVGPAVSTGQRNKFVEFL